MGAVVNALEEGGPAQKGGIEPGDVILKLDGKPINASADLPRIVGATKPGTRSVVQVWRKGSMRDITVVVGEMQDEKQAAARQPRSGKAPEQAANRIGLVVSELSAEQKREFKMNSGLVIESVRGTASRADLKPGDVLVALISKGATTELRTVDQFNKLLGQFEKGSNVTLLVRRGEMQTFVTIKNINGN
jgi:serine protease Do